VKFVIIQANLVDKNGMRQSVSNQLELYWDSTYAIVVSLLQTHPELSPESVGLMELADLVESLPGFQDDPALVTERILLDIQTVWYEEATA
jgi:FeS assembly protein IscX